MRISKRIRGLIERWYSSVLRRQRMARSVARSRQQNCCRVHDRIGLEFFEPRLLLSTSGFDSALPQMERDLQSASVTVVAHANEALVPLAQIADEDPFTLNIDFDSGVDDTGASQGDLVFNGPNGFQIRFTDDDSSGDQADGVHITNQNFGNVKAGSTTDFVLGAFNAPSGVNNFHTSGIVAQFSWGVESISFFDTDDDATTKTLFAFDADGNVIAQTEAGTQQPFTLSTADTGGQLIWSVEFDTQSGTAGGSNDGTFFTIDDFSVTGTIPPMDSVLLVDVFNGSYDVASTRMVNELIALGVNVTEVELTGAGGQVAAALAAEEYDQVWVYDLSAGADNFTSDWNAIAGWFNDQRAAGENIELIADGRILSSFWPPASTFEMRAVAENYYQNFRRADGGLLLGTDHAPDFTSGINTINSLIGVGPFMGNFSGATIPTDTANPLMSFPHTIASVHDHTTTGQPPSGFQVTLGQTLSPVAWHGVSANFPAITSTISGLAGFQVAIDLPAANAQFNQSQSVQFTSSVENNDGSVTYQWTSDLDGVIGTSASFSTDSLTVGTHTIQLLADDTGSAASDADQVQITILPLASGQTVSGAIDFVGDQDTFTIDAQAGDDLLFTIREDANFFNSLEVSLHGPDGELIETANGATGVRIDQIDLTQSGTYTYVVRDSQATFTGDYTLTAVVLDQTVDADNVALVSGQTENGVIGTGDIDTFTIDAQAGNDLLFTITEDANFFNSLEVSLHGPDGELIETANGATGVRIDQIDLTQSGTYTYVVRDSQATFTGDYTLTAVVLDQTVDADNVALVSGQTENGVIGTGDIDTFTIDAQAGNDLLFTITEDANFFNALEVSLYGPDGQLIETVSGASSVQLDRLSLAQGGRYTYVVRDSQAIFSGGYTLTATLGIQQTPVEVISATPDGHTSDQVSQINLTLSESVVAVDAEDSATYQLLNLGGDRQAGGGDDVVVPIVASYDPLTDVVDLQIQSSTPIELNQWSELDYAGDGSSGNWTVQDGGSSVFQSINGLPTFYASDFTQGPGRFVGEFRVETTRDDDYIGLAWGVTANASDTIPDDFYLLHWKQGTQNPGLRPGFQLIRVEDSINDEPDWTSEASAGSMTVIDLQKADSSAAGWKNNTWYNFDLTLLSDGTFTIEVFEKDTGLLEYSFTSDVTSDPNPLPAGRVGFFNWSQDSVRYRGLRSLDFLPEGAYQLTAVSGDPGIRDTVNGVGLDGDGDGVGGDDFVHHFVVDRTAPTVSSAAFTSNTTLRVDYVDVGGMDTVSMTDSTNYQLLASGGDGTFGDANDSSIVINSITQVDDGSVELNLGEAIGVEVYQLTIDGTSSVTDAAGNILDGDNDGNAGGDHVATIVVESFTVQITPPSELVLNDQEINTGFFTVISVMAFDQQLDMTVIAPPAPIAAQIGSGIAHDLFEAPGGTRVLSIVGFFDPTDPDLPNANFNYLLGSINDEADNLGFTAFLPLDTSDFAFQITDLGQTSSTFDNTDLFSSVDGKPTLNLTGGDFSFDNGVDPPIFVDLTPIGDGSAGSAGYQPHGTITGPRGFRPLIEVNEGQTATNSGVFLGSTLNLTSVEASVGTVSLTSSNGASWSFPTTDGPDETQVVTVTGSDDSGNEVSVTFDLIVNNVAPTADAGGPYTVAEGESVLLAGTGSDPGADTLSFQWDLDDDGVFGETGADAANGNETGATPTFDAGALAPGTVQPVTLRVTDSDGAASEDTSTVTVQGKPVVNLIATDADASESGPDTGSFLISRTGGTDDVLAVEYSISGTATNGSDYDAIAQVVTFGIGESEKVIVINPVDDSDLEPNEDVTLTLDVNDNYVVDGNENTDTVTISDNDDEVQPLQVTSFTVNGGAAQRSNVSTLAITFNRDTNLGDLSETELLSAVQIFNTTSDQQVSLSIAQFFYDSDTNTLTIDTTVDGFGGGIGDTLADGRYEVRLAANFVRAADDNTALADDDGTADGMHTLTFHRLLADWDGSATVDDFDRALFLPHYRSLNGQPGYHVIFDTDRDGRIDRFDYLQWRNQTRVGI